MLNDWKWEKIDDSEYRLTDYDGQTVAYLVRNFGDSWFCRLINRRFDIHFGRIYDNVTSIEWLKWQATIWIQDECNRIANSFHYIRDHLPNLNKLYEAEENICN